MLQEHLQDLQASPQALCSELESSTLAACEQRCLRNTVPLNVPARTRHCQGGVCQVEREVGPSQNERHLLRQAEQAGGHTRGLETPETTEVGKERRPEGDGCHPGLPAHAGTCPTAPPPLPPS